MICVIFLVLALGTAWHSTQMQRVKEAKEDNTEQLRSCAVDLKRNIQCVAQEIEYIDACRTGADFGQEDP